MTKSDDIILEYLEETGMALPPRAISYNLQTRENADISYSTVNRRIKILLDNGLVDKLEDPTGYYLITDLGQRYLRGDAEISELE